MIDVWKLSECGANLGVLYMVLCLHLLFSFKKIDLDNYIFLLQLIKFYCWDSSYIIDKHQSYTTRIQASIGSASVYLVHSRSLSVSQPCQRTSYLVSCYPMIAANQSLPMAMKTNSNDLTTESDNLDWIDEIELRPWNELTEETESTLKRWS